MFLKSRYHPDYGFTLYDISNYKIESDLSKWDQGEISDESFADVLIEAFFDSEFVGDGKHWSRDCSRVSPTTVDAIPNVAPDITISADIKWFKCEMSATWDWKDIYSVASSKGIIGLDRSSKLIILDDYSYYVSG